jgi:hypothetical protein
MSGLRRRDQVRRSVGKPARLLLTKTIDDPGMGKSFRQLGFARIRRDHLLEVLGDAGRGLAVAGTAIPRKPALR